MDSVPLSNRIRAIAGKFQRRLVLLQRKLLIRRAKSACRRTQHKVLRRLLRLNSGSQFSRDFGLSPGMSLEEFRRRIPVSGYELIRPYVDRVRNGEHSALLGTQKSSGDVCCDQRYDIGVQADSDHETIRERLSARLAGMGNRYLSEVSGGGSS